jgi:site-specific recombinase XerD
MKSQLQMQDESNKKSLILAAVLAVILAGGITIGLLWVLLNVSWIQKHFETTVEVNNETLINQVVNLSDTCNQALTQYIQACQDLRSRWAVTCQELFGW